MRKKRGGATCVEVVHQVGEDLDQLLHGDMYALIGHHLDDCPNCEAYIDSMRKLIKLYKRYPDPKLRKKARKRLHRIIPLPN